MPLPTPVRVLRYTVRRVVEEGARNLPEGARDLPGRAVRVAVVGVGHALAFVDQVRARAAEEAGGTTAQEKPPEWADQRPAETPADTRADAAADGAVPRQAVPPEEAASAEVADDLPVPNYEEQSVGSLRARLRYLTLDDVVRLRDYERAHASRPTVVTMFENRIAKLEQEAGDAKAGSRRQGTKRSGGSHRRSSG